MDKARKLGLAVFGSGVGGLFLWLAIRKVDVAAVLQIAGEIDTRAVITAVALYWVAMVGRVFRWRVLLQKLAPSPFGAVSETLVVGYAVNNLLPARLGEVARAAYAKRRLKIGRARVFGSIFVERFLDLGAIALCLYVGLLVVGLVTEADFLATFEVIAINTGLVILVLLLAFGMFRSGAHERFSWPQPVVAILSDFRVGLSTLDRDTVAVCVPLTGFIWCFEILALRQIFFAVGVQLGTAQALLLMGAASLSTLIPTAPGYLGTYQLVAVLAMNAFALNANAGIVAATATQIALFGSVTAAGMSILLIRSIRRLAIDGPSGFTHRDVTD